MAFVAISKKYDIGPLFLYYNEADKFFSDMSIIHSNISLFS